MRRSDGTTWMAFLAMAFAVVGLTGLFATYAAPLTLQREMARDAALDAVLAGTPPDALRDRLGDSAAAVLDGPGPLATRVAIERAAMHARFAAEAAATETRLRWLIAMVTLMGAAFGAAVIGALVKREPAPPAG